MIRALLTLIMILGGNTMSADEAIKDMLKLWDFQDPGATETNFRALLSEADPSNGFKPALLSQIARTYSLRDRFEEAHQHLDEAEALLTEDLPLPKTLIALERGRAYNSNDQQDKALPVFHKAFTIADSNHLDDLAVDAAHMIAIAESGQRAERWNLIAMAIAETSDDPGAQRWLGPLYNNLGWTYFDAGDLDKALALFEKGVTFRKNASNQTREWQIARWTVARTHREMGRLDEAHHAQLTLLGEVADGTPQAGYINEELGELYLIQEDPAATAHFAKAFEILNEDSWLRKHESGRLARLKQLGGLDE